jgi:hypothetical protein
LSSYSVGTKDVPGQEVVALRRTVVVYEIGSLFAELGSRLRCFPCGPPQALYHGVGPDPLRVDVEVVFPVPEKGDKVIPGGEVAFITHLGGYDAIPNARTALVHWVDDMGLRAVGPLREVYIVGPHTTRDPGRYVTEIQLPIASPTTGCPGSSAS